MSQIALQPINTQQARYFKPTKTETERVPVNGAKTLTEMKSREEQLEFIAFLTQYMEDLKAGRAVENLSPSNDPYYLVPENIASIIRGEKELLEGKGTVVNNLKDIIGEWGG